MSLSCLFSLLLGPRALTLHLRTSAADLSWYPSSPKWALVLLGIPQVSFPGQGQVGGLLFPPTLASPSPEKSPDCWLVAGPLNSEERAPK